MSRQPCGIKLGNKNARINIYIMDEVSDEIVFKVYLIDIESADLLFLLSELKFPLDEAKLKGLGQPGLTVQQTSAGQAIGYSESGAARVRLTCESQNYETPLIECEFEITVGSTNYKSPRQAIKPTEFVEWFVIS